MNNPSACGADYEFETEAQAREAFKNIPEGWTPEIHPFEDKFIVWARNQNGSTGAIVQSGLLHIFSHSQADCVIEANGYIHPCQANLAINAKSGVSILDKDREYR